jgi:hypothetical protein
METQDIVVLRTTQIAALLTAQLMALTTSQLSALTTTQVESIPAISTAQISAFTTTQIQYLHLGTPLVLDLNGNGIETQSVRNGVQFDIYGTGEKVATGWVTGGDGLLVLDRNGDGTVNSGSELFGQATLLANGERAATGYEALADLDSNSDGVINASDAQFQQLQVWVDGNSDGVSQRAELLKLQDLGITELSLNAKSTPTFNNGNIIGMDSSFTTADGSSHAMGDVWFMTHKVSDMVQAMSSYDTTSSAGGNSLPVDAAPAGAGTANVGQLVGVLSQYDPNGQPLLGNAPAATPSLVPQPLDPNHPLVNGLLVNGK